MLTKPLVGQSAYQNPRALFVIEYRSQMKCCAPMFTPLLNVDEVAISTYYLQSFDFILLCGKVNRRKIFLVQDICSNGTVIGIKQGGK